MMKKSAVSSKGGSRSSSLILLEAMAKKIKTLGGKEKWTAKLRDSTSLQYMKIMALRGVIDMDIGSVDHTMSDGTQVIKVKFSVNDKPESQRGNTLPSPERPSQEQINSDHGR